MFRRIHSSGRSPSALLGAAATAMVLAGCAYVAPGGLPPGTPIAEARHAIFGPTGEYPLPGGGTRLEFAQGGMAKATYMLDFDAKGSLVSTQQVLTESNLQAIQPGMSQDQVRMNFGRPVWIYGVQFQKLHIWNYRFSGGDCVWYQVSLSDATHLVTQAGIGPDPGCDGPSHR